MKARKGKRQLPKTVVGKKTFRYGFWALLLYIALGLTANLVMGSQQTEADTGQAEREEKKENVAASIAGQTFAKEFTRQYLIFKPGGEEERQQRLERYLAPGVDPQAGIHYEGMKFNSWPVRVEIWNVKPMGDNKADMTLKVETIGAYTDPKTKKKETTGPHVRYVSVPIVTDGQNFRVYDVPHYVMKPKEADITLTEEENRTPHNDSQTRTEITDFLNSFFKVYVTGTPEEISYFMKAKESNSLKGMVNFQNIDDLLVFKEKNSKSNEYTVKLNVYYVDWISKGTLVYPYEMKLVKEGNRWFVTDMQTKS